jgi:BNR/Asp-box repeat
MRRRVMLVILALGLAGAFAWFGAGRGLHGVTAGPRKATTAALGVTTTAPGVAGSRGGETDGGGDPDAGDTTTEQRLAALEQARAEGTLGVSGPLRRAAAPGWAGERPVSRTFDDWEPAIAADPTAPFVYRLVTRYGGPTACAADCPDPAIILQVSKDDGATWGPYRFLCRCKGTRGMYDPQIEVADGTGTVMAAFMRGYSVWFTRSTDHGKTWTKPVPVYGNVAWQDKPLLVTSADGNDVYLAFNGPSGGDAWVAFSHDGGDTWHRRKVTHGTRYLFAFGGTVLADGSVVFAESSLTYGPNNNDLVGTSRPTVLRSTDGGRTWNVIRVDTLRLGVACRFHCRPDYYAGHIVVAEARPGVLVLLADGAIKTRGLQSVWAYVSADGGQTWSARKRISHGSANGGFPAETADGRGAVRAWFADRSTGRWQIWYRTSPDGVAWSAPVQISDASSGAVYKSPKGFRQFYGDYGEIDVTDTGATVAIWGEARSYWGPGGAWFNRQT